jgi:tight adherence protein C
VFLFLAIGVLLIGGSAALVGRALALPRINARRRLTKLDVYGFAGAAETVAPDRPLGGAVDKLARSLGAIAARRMKSLSEEATRRELMAAGMYRTTPVTLVGYRVMCALGFPTALWVLGAGSLEGAKLVFATLVLTVVGWLGPITLVRRRARFRLARIDYELPELVDLLVLTVETGMGFAGSMQIAGQRFSGPLGDEVRLALQEQSMGLPAERALANMCERAPSDAMRSFVRSIRQGEALGVSIGQIMRSLAKEMRDRRRAAAEERAQKAPIKILFPLVALIFPSIFVVLLAPAILNIVDTMAVG